MSNGKRLLSSSYGREEDMEIGGEEEEGEVERTQSPEVQEEMIDDDYDDEDDEMNQRLSPLHHQYTAQAANQPGGNQAKVLSQEAENLGMQDYGFDVEDDGQEEGEEDEEEMDDDERLLRMARKLHSKVEKDDHITITEEFPKDTEEDVPATKKEEG